MKDPREPDDYLSRGLSSVIRRQRARDGGEAPLPVEPETEPLPSELAGRPVVDLIGRGGVGLVYRVCDRDLGRELAVKVLSRRHAGEPDMIRRFEAEARVCAQLQHPGVVPIHEAGRLSDGRPYFTMKVVEGDTLVALLGVRDPLTSNRRGFLEVFAKVCQTLAYVHAQGVVHGDLKPSNIMVGAFGEVQVMDWGFARRVDPEFAPQPGGSPSQSSPMRVLGTPAYMAPEQARGDELGITSRTDVFGLGAILCEILTGRPPYAGETRSAAYLAATQCWQDDTRAALRNCDADPVLVDLALRCLEPAPERRPIDAAAVADEIAVHLENIEARARDLEFKAVAAEARAAQERRSRRIVFSLGSGLLLAVVAVAGTLVWLQNERVSRDAEARRLLADLVNQGRSLAERARIQDARGLLYWDAAQSALTQAYELARTRSAADAERRGVAALLESVTAEAVAARRANALVTWAGQMRPHYTDDRDAITLVHGYRAGFARFGFMFSGPPDVVATQIRVSPVADVLCAAVDDWARVARNHDGGNATGNIDWRALVDIARRADPQPFRDRLRAAFRDDRLADLQQLARADELRAAAPATVNLLAKCLFDLGAREQAIEVLRDGARRHPDDFWILHDLGVFLRRQPVPPREEILGLCRAAVALRPTDPHALSDFAHTLAFLQDQWGPAGEVIERAIAMQPDYTRSWFPEVLVLVGHRDQALSIARSNVEQAPGDIVPLGVLSWTAAILGEFAEAARASRQASDLQPSDLGARLELVSALVALGDVEGARAAAIEARRLAALPPMVRVWSTFDDALTAGLERTVDPVALESRDGWPDVARGIANQILGRSERAAEELRNWLDSNPADVQCAHFVIAVAAALDAASAAREPAAVADWRQTAVRFLRAAFGACKCDAKEADANRVTLTRLRWLQADPVMRDEAWTGSVRTEFEALRESMRVATTELLGR